MFAIVLPIEGRADTGSRLRVAHGDLDLPRGLEPDEYVVLEDAYSDRRFLGRVVGLDFTIDDTVYDLHVDGPLTAEVADGYVGRRRGVQTHHVAALLEELADARVVS